MTIVELLTVALLATICPHLGSLFCWLVWKRPSLPSPRDLGLDEPLPAARPPIPKELRDTVRKSTNSTCADCGAKLRGGHGIEIMGHPTKPMCPRCYHRSEGARIPIPCDLEKPTEWKEGMFNDPPSELLSKGNGEAGPLPKEIDSQRVIGRETHEFDPSYATCRCGMVLTGTHLRDRGEVVHCKCGVRLKGNIPKTIVGYRVDPMCPKCLKDNSDTKIPFPCDAEENGVLA